MVKFTIRGWLAATAILIVVLFGPPLIGLPAIFAASCRFFAPKSMRVFTFCFLFWTAAIAFPVVAMLHAYSQLLVSGFWLPASLAINFAGGLGAIISFYVEKSFTSVGE